MQTTIYRYSNQDTVRVVGCYPAYGLDKHSCGDLEWCDPIEIDLPDGYSIAKCYDGSHRLTNPDGLVCDLVPNRDYGFWVMPLNGVAGFGLYVSIDDNDVATIREG